MPKLAAHKDRGRPRSGCDDRPEHPLGRTLREDRRRDRPNPAHRQTAPAQRLRTHLPGSGPGRARLSLRSPMAALRPRPPARHVPPPTAATGLQQAAARSAPTGQAGHPDPRHGHRLLVRQRMDHRLHPRRVRPFTSHRQALEPGGLGRLRLLPLAQPLLLGTAAVPGLHPGGDPGPWPARRSTNAKR